MSSSRPPTSGQAPRAAAAAAAAPTTTNGSGSGSSSSASAAKGSNSSSARVGSGGIARPKAAHSALQHARFHASPTAVRTSVLQDPFSVYAQKLAALEATATARQCASHHVVVDAVRVLEDLLVHACAAFLEQRAPPLLLSLTAEQALGGVCERLRDAELISPWTNRQIDEARKLARWTLLSSAREVPWETSHNLLLLVSKLCAAFMADVEHARAARPKSGCPAHHAFCRDMMPMHLDVVGGPHDAHTIPPSRPATAAAPTAQAGEGAAAAATVTSPTAAGAAAAPTGGLANPDSKKLKPKPRAHDALPYGWSRAEFEAHCAPLHNTAHLDLQALEDEEEEKEREELAAKEAERADKIRLREEAAERRRERRDAEDAARAAARLGPDGADLSDLDENPEEVDSEEERLTARRKQARAAAGEGAKPEQTVAPAAAEEEEEEEDSEDEDDDDETKAARAERRAAAAALKAADAEDEKVANEPIPPPATKPQRFAFTFCCIVCHSVLLRARDIDRVCAGQVWSKPGRNLNGKSVLKNFTDSWASRPADEREPRAPVEGEEEEEEEPAQDDDDDSANPLTDVPKDEGAAKREDSIGVQCAGCDYYLGRYFPARDAYRLIYIQRSSGQNFMYYTGDASAERLRPALQRLSEEQEEEREAAEAAAEEQGSDEEDEQFAKRRAAQAEAKRAAPVPPVVGLPHEYTDPRQAALYPFPRFGSAAPYNRPSSWQLFHAMVTDAQKAAALLAAALPKQDEESKSNDNGSAAAGSNGSNGASVSLGSTLSLGLSQSLGSVGSGARGVKSVVKANSKTFRPLIPPVPLIHTLLRRQPDSHYELAPEDAAHLPAVTADLSVLLWTDRAFHNRRAMDAVSARVVALFRHFPSGVYANTTSPPVPLFTHFYVRDGPDFTMCRGTARYVFHALTKKDDGKLKRTQYTYKRFLKALARWENAVFHLSAGGHGGHRFVLVKVGAAFRVFQSNHCLESAADRYTCLQWLCSDYPWSRTLDLGELQAFLAKFEEARRGRQALWQELFCCGQKAQALFDVSDLWQPDQVYYASAKLLDSAIQL